MQNTVIHHLKSLQNRLFSKRRTVRNPVPGMSSSTSPSANEFLENGMSEHYEREGFRENEGDNSWKRVAAFLKDFFNYDPNEQWDYDGHPEFFHWGLDGGEIRLLNLSINSLSHNCIAPTRQIIKGMPRLGPFRHICLWFPRNHGNHFFSYERDAVRAYKNIVVEMLTSLFPGHQIGYYFRTAYQPSDGTMPEMHIHIILSSILFRLDDYEYLETFKKLEAKERPYHALYFLTEPIMYSTDLAAFIEPLWRAAIKEATGRKVKSEQSLVSVTGKNGQTILDRYYALRYVSNQARHTFSKVKKLSLAKDGKIVIEFKPHYGITPKPFAMLQGDFVRMYLIKPMRTFGVQFRGRGFLCGRSSFAQVADAASRLVLNNPGEEGERRKFLFDLPVAKIKERAIAARRCLERGDAKGFKHIRAQYRLGDPLEELAVLLELERKRRIAEYEEVKMLKVIKISKEVEEFMMALD